MCQVTYLYCVTQYCYGYYMLTLKSVQIICLAALKAKCSTDLDELLDFKVKQYGEGTDMIT